VKFDVQEAISNVSLGMTNYLIGSWAWSVSHDHFFKFWGPSYNTFEMVEASHIRFGVMIDIEQY